MAEFASLSLQAASRTAQRGSRDGTAELFGKAEDGRQSPTYTASIRSARTLVVGTTELYRNGKIRLIPVRLPSPACCCSQLLTMYACNCRCRRPIPRVCYVPATPEADMAPPCESALG